MVARTLNLKNWRIETHERLRDVGRISKEGM